MNDVKSVVMRRPEGVSINPRATQTVDDRNGDAANADTLNLALTLVLVLLIGFRWCCCSINGVKRMVDPSKSDDNPPVAAPALGERWSGDGIPTSPVRRQGDTPKIRPGLGPSMASRGDRSGRPNPYSPAGI